MTDPEVVSRAELARREIPFAVQRLAQFVVDNPLQVALIGAGALTAVAAARNIVKPRNLLEVVAMCLVLEAATPWACKQIVERGWLPFRVRDADGHLVTLQTGKGS